MYRHIVSEPCGHLGVKTEFEQWVFMEPLKLGLIGVSLA